MKYRLLEILQCPKCGGAFELDVFEADRRPQSSPPDTTMACRIRCGFLDRPVQVLQAGQCAACLSHAIGEGRLRCPCGAAYPIIGGIPRLLPDALLAECLHRYHSDFIRRHGNKFSVPPPLPGASDRKAATMHAFGYQWTTFVENFDYFRGIFLSFVQPYLQPDDFRDKLVLEVGCGSGRPASVASSFGGEVIAADLSEAVETAHAQSQHYPRLHVVQADAYALPFNACFDFVYSVGVIQHIPDPARALAGIARVVPAGRRLIIWVYGKREWWYQPIEWLRHLTTRMPYAVLRAFATLLAMLSELFLLIPYRILARIPPARVLAQIIPGRIYASFPFRENVLGWFDRLAAPITHYFSSEDVERLLRGAGFIEISVIARPGASASWIAQGTRSDDQAPHR